MKENIFNHVAPFYEKVFKRHIVEYYLNKRIEVVKKFFPDKNIKILDVGCGTGLFLYSLRKEGYNNLWGIDISENMIKIAKERLNDRVLKGDILSIPFCNSTFDLTVSIVTLHHLGKKWKVRKGIEEMVRVTKKGGYILIWEHNPLNFYWYILMKRVPQDKGEVKLISSGEMARELRRNNVKIIKIFKTGLLPDFASEKLVSFFVFLERGIEKIFPLNQFLAHNIIIGRKE